MPNQLELECTAKAAGRQAPIVLFDRFHDRQEKFYNSALRRKIVYEKGNLEMVKKALTLASLKVKSPPKEIPRYCYKTRLLMFKKDAILRKKRPRPSYLTWVIRNEFLKMTSEDIPLFSKKNRIIWRYKLRQNLRLPMVTTASSDELSSGGKSDGPPTSKGLVSCCVCADIKASLRCPACLKKYCKLACFKAHKDSNICKMTTEVESAPAAAVPVMQVKQYNFPTKDTVAVEQLEKLSSGTNLDKLKEFLKNKMIKYAIAHLNKTTNPVEDFRKVMTNEDFVKFADFVLTVLKK